MAHKYLPPDVSSDIHQILTKAMHARLARQFPGVLAGDLTVVFTRTELEAAAEAEFEYDVLDDGSILLRPAGD